LEKKKKEVFISDMNSRLKKAQATFLVEYQGIDAGSMNRVRGELRKIGAEFKVIKNRLLKLASLDTGTESIREQFVGPCAIAITYDDIVGPAKVLLELSKDIKNLKLKAGQISGKPMDLDSLKKLASLPGREQLLAQLLSVMNAVPTSLVRVLNGVMLKMMYVLQAIENKKANEHLSTDNG
jgi:large subunit ribosomal protein L10